jgi:hypothetical protein
MKNGSLLVEVERKEVRLHGKLYKQSLCGSHGPDVLTQYALETLRCGFPVSGRDTGRYPSARPSKPSAEILPLDAETGAYLFQLKYGCRCLEFWRDAG